MMLIIRLCAVLVGLLLLIGCKTTGKSRFASLIEDSPLPAMNANGVVETSADGYKYSYKLLNPKQSAAVTYNRHIFATAALEAYSTGTHPFSKMKPEVFVQSVEQRALELGKRPSLELAAFVDEATGDPRHDASIDEHLYWLAREKILAQTSVSDHPSLLYQKRGNKHLVVTERIHLNDRACRIKAFIVDDQSRPILGAQLHIPDGTHVDDSLLRDATQLMWDTIDL